MPDCTFAPDKIKTYDFSFCCALHDDEYRKGDRTRFEIDWGFYRCLLSTGCNPKIAETYFLMVRKFGWLWWYKARVKQWWENR